MKQEAGADEEVGGFGHKGRSTGFFSVNQEGDREWRYARTFMLFTRQAVWIMGNTNERV